MLKFGHPLGNVPIGYTIEFGNSSRMYSMPSGKFTVSMDIGQSSASSALGVARGSPIPVYKNNLPGRSPYKTFDISKGTVF